MLEKTTWRSKAFHVFEALFIALVFSFTYIPLIIVVYQSFNKSANSIIPLQWGGFTFEHFGALFANRMLYTSILDSLLVSLWATLIATVFGLFASFGIHSLGRKARKAMDFLNEIPMLSSEIVTGISLMIIFSLLKPVFPMIFGFPSMLLAHIYFTVPYVIMMVLPKLEQTDDSLYEAARDLGCSPLKALFKVVIPSLSTAILMGALIAFTLSIDDFVISFYTQGNGFSNFSNYVYSSYTKKNFSPGAYAFDTLLTFVTLGIVLLASLKTGKKKGASK